MSGIAQYFGGLTESRVYPSGIGSSNVVPSRGIVDIVFRHNAALYLRKVDAAVVADVLDARMLAIFVWASSLCL